MSFRINTKTSFSGRRFADIDDLITLLLDGAAKTDNADKKSAWLEVIERLRLLK